MTTNTGDNNMDNGQIDFTNLSAKECMRILLEHPDQADKCDWNELRRQLKWYEWRLLLKAQPQFADKCDWSRIAGKDWATLLEDCPQFADRCDKWDEITGFGWTRLLEAQPQFADKCDWAKLDGGDWMGLLLTHPEFADKCDWKKVRKQLDGYNWVTLLKAQPQFAEHCRFSKFDGEHWCDLLKEQPQFADKCDWESIDDDSLWCDLLQKQPQFADKCDFAEWYGGCFAELLKEQPALADKCDFAKLYGDDWAGLLSAQPQFADKCDFAKLDGDDWAGLLSVQQQFADKCDWTKLDGRDWVRLLSAHPEFADKCDWSKISLANVASLCAKQPDLAAMAKDKKGINGKILQLSVEPEIRPVEFGFMPLKEYWKEFNQNPGLQEELADYGGNIYAVPLDIEFGMAGYYMVLGESDSKGKWGWNGLSVKVRLDGETVFEESVSPGDAHGVAFPEMPSPLEIDFGEGKDEWLVGAARWRLVLWVECLKEVPADFRFDPAKLSIPFFRMPTDYGAEPSAIVNHHAVRYDGFDEGDFTSDWEPDCEKDRTYLLMTRDGMRPFAERMTGYDWAQLLSHSPQYADMCNWRRLSGSDWALLLAARPEFADKCHCWDRFSDWHWDALLKAQPQFADKRGK